MSTILNTNLEAVTLPAPPPGFRCHIIAARWNAEITDRLLQGAVDTLRRAGVEEKDIITTRVPGTVELTYVAARAMQSMTPESAIIIIGCVIRGDTAHFDYVCQSVTQGMTQLNALGKIPVIFGVLTVDNMEQAIARAGGNLGNKGSEAAAAALEMASLSL